MGDGLAYAKARKGSGCRPGQQNGAYRMGPDDKRDQLQARDELTKHIAVFEEKPVGEVLMV